MAKKTTNADFIRAMSDDRLAALFFKLALYDVRPWCNFHCMRDEKYGCKKCMMEWLRQPAEVD